MLLFEHIFEKIKKNIKQNSKGSIIFQYINIYIFDVQIILEIQAGFKDKWKTAENKKALVRLTSDKKLLSALLKYLVESSNERYENENSDDLFKVINELTTWANNH